MHILTIAPCDNAHAARLSELLAQRGHRVSVVHRLPDAWLQDGPPRYDACLPWVMIRDLRHFGFGRWQAALVVEAAGVPMLNGTRAIALAADKLATHARFAACGLPQPRTFQFAGPLAPWPAPGPLVLKPTLSWGGADVHLVSDAASAHELAGAWPSPALLQEHIEDPVCLRVIASDREALYAAEKRVSPGTLVASVGLGAQAVRLGEVPDDVARLAVAMVRALGGGLMGVDILRSAQNELLALEANVPFGFDLEDRAKADRIADAVEAGWRRGEVSVSEP